MVLQTAAKLFPEKLINDVSARRALIDKIVEKVEFAFVFFSFFLFTDAVTMVVLAGGASEGDGFSYDSINYAPVQLLRFANYGLTLFFIACRYKRTIYVLLSNPLFLAANIFISGSFFWSAAPSSSMAAGFSIFFNMLFSVYLAGRYTLKQQLRILSYVMVAIAFLSILFVFFLPQYGVMGPPVHPGKWRGVFTHKNGAGKMMVLACGTMFVMFNEVKNKHLKWMYAFGLFFALMLIDNTQSGGALVNTFFIILIISILQVFKAESRKLALAIIFLITSGVFIGLAYVPLMTFGLGLIGKDPTLTGRTDIWEFVGDMISNRPILGYGLAGFWHGTGGESLYVIERAGWRVPDSHHGFLDLTLQIGYLGTAMVGLMLWQTLLRGLSRIRLFKTWVSSWPAVYVLYLSLINMSESSLLAPNSIFWTLFCTMNITTAFEAKYLVDFDRFGVIPKSSDRESVTEDQIAGKLKPAVNAHVNE